MSLTVERDRLLNSSRTANTQHLTIRQQVTSIGPDIHDYVTPLRGPLLSYRECLHPLRQWRGGSYEGDARKFV